MKIEFTDLPTSGGKIQVSFDGGSSFADYNVEDVRASAFGKDWILLIVIASVITLYNIVRFRQMSNLFTTLFQDIAIKKTHGNKSRVFECLILKSIEKCFYSAKSGVERYLSPLSGNKTTIFLPAFSGRLAT